MGKVAAIAQNTFKEAIRNRVMYIILLFAICMILASFVIKDLTIAAHGDVIRSFGHFSISVFGLVIAVFLGIGSVYNEMDKRTLYTIVSKPIDRWQFLLGKYLGLLLTLYLLTLVMTGVFLAVTWILNRSIADPYFGLATLKSLKAIGLGCLELGVIMAFALLFSSFSTPILSGFMTLMVLIAGRLNEDIERYAQSVVKNAGGTPEQSQSFLEGLAFLVGGGGGEAAGGGISSALVFLFAKFAALVFPNLEMLNARVEAIHFDTVDANYLALITRSGTDALLYAVPYTVAVLLVAMFLFSRRNFK